MTDREEAKRRVQEILSDSMEGKFPERMEEYLTAINQDYDEMYEKMGDTGTEWRGKYEELKKKYVERFTSAPPAEVHEKMSEASGSGETEDEIVHEDESTIEDITIEELFEEG